jgi:two-component system, cell cycle response regulator
MRSVDESPIRVVVVDGDPGAEDSLLRFQSPMAAAGIAVEAFPELDPALKRVTQGGTDLLLLDLEIPGGGGFASFERAVAFVPDVPIITLSEDPDPATALAAMQAGAQDHLVRSELNAGLLVRAALYAMERHRLVTALRSLSVIDDLTGLYNRRGFMDLGEQHLKLARRSGRGMTLVYCDLDRFKEINDTLGHAEGDRALRKLTELLRSSFRRSDIVGRLGGDEFAVLALEVSGEDEGMLVSRIRRKLEAFNALEAEPFALSLSLGMARFDRDTGGNLGDLLARADEAMYGEKRMKRGRGEVR